MIEWIITNNYYIEITKLKLSFRNNRFTFYHKGTGLYSFYIEGNKVSIIIDGYILPRIDYANEFCGYTAESLIKELYVKYNLEFINYIKGNFVIIIIEGDNFYIFNDSIGIRKFFYCTKGSNFIFSNCFKVITDIICSDVDYDSLAIYSLMNQFIDGMTFLKDVFYSKPAAKIWFNGELRFEYYWNCEVLSNPGSEKISIENISEGLTGIIKSYIDYLNPDNISLTLTGGLDSRTILAALLKMGINPGTFTYGHPHSGDVVTAKKVAEICGLIHKNYYVKPTVTWFSKLVEDIIDKGNSLTHIHRAHRLFAAAASSSNEPDNEIIFAGYMGGELIRCFHYDGIIIPDFARDWINGKLKREQLIISYLKKNFFKIDNIDIDRIAKILSNQRFSSNEPRLNEFFFTFLIASGVHHAQELNLLGHYKKYPVPIYLDIDFLRLIFGSKYNFMFSGDLLGGYIKPITSHGLYCHLIYRLSPLLAGIPLFKRGYYTPKEFVEDNRLIFIAKRLMRKIFSRQKYPVNFSLDDWMKNYTANEIEILQNSNIIRDIINVEELRKCFNKNNHKTYEKYWRKYTNPIFFSKLFDFYLPG